MKIFLVRHGQDQDNAANILNGQRNTNLTEFGQKQAEETGKKLQDKEIITIYSSPLKRAYETAQIIAKYLGINKIITIPDLKERDLGKLSGLPLEKARDKATKLFPTPTYTYISEAEGMETFSEQLERAKKVLKEIFNQTKEGNILIVAHNDMIIMLKAAFLGKSWQEVLLTTPYLDNGQIVELKTK